MQRFKYGNIEVCKSHLCLQTIYAIYILTPTHSPMPMKQFFSFFLQVLIRTAIANWENTACLEWMKADQNHIKKIKRPAFVEKKKSSHSDFPDFLAYQSTVQAIYSGPTYSAFPSLQA